MHIFPVYLSTPHEPNDAATPVFFTGGLGLHASAIGLWLSVFGIFGILLQLFIYSSHRIARVGTLGVFRDLSDYVPAGVSSRAVPALSRQTPAPGFSQVVRTCRGSYGGR